MVRSSDQTKPSEQADPPLIESSWWKNSQMLFSNTTEFYQWQRILHPQQQGRKDNTSNNPWAKYLLIDEQTALWKSTVPKLKSCMIKAFGVKSQASFDHMMSENQKEILEWFTDWISNEPA